MLISASFPVGLSHHIARLHVEQVNLLFLQPPEPQDTDLQTTSLLSRLHLPGMKRYRPLEHRLVDSMSVYELGLLVIADPVV